MTMINDVEELRAELRNSRLTASERRDAEARMAAATEAPREHHLFETGDADAPEAIKD